MFEIHRIWNIRIRACLHEHHFSASTVYTKSMISVSVLEHAVVPCNTTFKFPHPIVLISESCESDSVSGFSCPVK